MGTTYCSLDAAIENSGMTITAIAKKTGINKGTLYNRLRGVGEFKASEITALTEVLHLTRADRDTIFFTKGLN